MSRANRVNEGETTAAPADVPAPAAEAIEPKAKRERKAAAKPDLFTVAKRVANVLAVFPLDERLQALRFVQGVLEKQLREETAAVFAAQHPAQPSRHDTEAPLSNRLTPPSGSDELAAHAAPN